MTITATDVDQNKGSITVNLTVITAVTISTTSLPTGTAGQAFSQTLSPANGSSPYTWSITSGNAALRVEPLNRGRFERNDELHGIFPDHGQSSGQLRRSGNQSIHPHHKLSLQHASDSHV
jgi:hypothetical protein